MPAGHEMPSVEVLKLDGTFAAGDGALQMAILQSEKNHAWTTVFAALNDLTTNQIVNWSPAAVEFVRVTAELARTASLADTVEEALQPLDGLLPMGAHGEKLYKQGHNKGNVTAKVALYRDLKRRYPKLGPEGIAKHISCAVGKQTDTKIDECFASVNFQIIERSTGQTIKVGQIAKQVKDALKPAQSRAPR